MPTKFFTAQNLINVDFFFLSYNNNFGNPPPQFLVCNMQFWPSFVFQTLNVDLFLQPSPTPDML